MGSYLHYSIKDLMGFNYEDLICVISHNMTHISGDSQEPFFDSLFHIIKKSDQKFKKDFFGKDKLLVLFFISDQWGWYDKEYSNQIKPGFSVQQIKDIADHFSEGTLRLLQSVVDRENVRTYAVVFNVDDHHRRAEICGKYEYFEKGLGDDGTGRTIENYPYHLYSLIKKTGGFRASICKTDWGKRLANVFDDLKTSFAPRFFNLDDVPKLDTIEIFLNGKKNPKRY